MSPRPRQPSSRTTSSWLSGALMFLLGCLVTLVLGVVSGIVPPGRLASLFSGTSATTNAGLPANETNRGVADIAPVPDPGSGVMTEPAQASDRSTRDEAIGDWRFTCVEPAAGGEPVCSILQQLRIAETGAAVFVWRVVANGSGGMVGMWQVPDNVDQTKGLTLNAGTPQPIVMPFEACGEGSCRVTGNLTPDFIRALAAAESLSAYVQAQDGTSVNFPLSAKGLAAALAALAATDKAG